MLYGEISSSSGERGESSRAVAAHSFVHSKLQRPLTVNRCYCYTSLRVTRIISIAEKGEKYRYVTEAMKGWFTSIRCSTDTVLYNIVDTFMYHIVIYTHVCARHTETRRFVAYMRIHTRIYTFTYIAEWSVVRDIGEAKLHPFFFHHSDSRDHGRILSPRTISLVVVNATETRHRRETARNSRASSVQAREIDDDFRANSSRSSNSSLENPPRDPITGDRGVCAQREAKIRRVSFAIPKFLGVEFHSERRVITESHGVRVSFDSCRVNSPLRIVERVLSLEIEG